VASALKGAPFSTGKGYVPYVASRQAGRPFTRARAATTIASGSRQRPGGRISRESSGLSAGRRHHSDHSMAPPGQGSAGMLG
jgi:hypothetical protein